MALGVKPIALLFCITLSLFGESLDALSLKSTALSPINANANLGSTLTPPEDAAHIFVLHRFDDKEHMSTSVSTDQLTKLFDYLNRNNYHVAKLSEFIEKFHNNEEIPSHWVLFSIDDSYKSFYENGFPLFKKYHFPFVLYVYIEATERHFGDFMSWKQIKEISQFGELGLHSFGHKHMTTISEDAMHRDTSKALALFEKHLGYKPLSYAYPFGEFDEKLQKVIKSYHFDLIFNQNSGAVSHKSSVYDLDRIALMGVIDIKEKLGIKFLPAVWKHVDIDREKRILHKIELSIDPRYKSIQCFISGDKWHTLKPKEGKISHIFDLKLNKGRSRIIIKTPDNRWSSKIIIL